MRGFFLQTVSRGQAWRASRNTTLSYFSSPRRISAHETFKRAKNIVVVNADLDAVASLAPSPASRKVYLASSDFKNPSHGKVVKRRVEFVLSVWAQTFLPQSFKWG